jgi:hypothetical protein
MKVLGHATIGACGAFASAKWYWAGSTVVGAGLVGLGHPRRVRPAGTLAWAATVGPSYPLEQRWAGREGSGNSRGDPRS